jgi:excisionase family DNA binding protein
MEPPLLRVQEAAALLRVSKWTIYRWIEEGRLRATKIGRGSLRIFRASLNGLIEGQRTDQASQESNGRSKVVRVRSSLRASKRRG